MSSRVPVAQSPGSFAVERFQDARERLGDVRKELRDQKDRIRSKENEGASVPEWWMENLKKLESEETQLEEEIRISSDKVEKVLVQKTENAKKQQDSEQCSGIVFAFFLGNQFATARLRFWPLVFFGDNQNWPTAAKENW